jgi:hypothetical protein
MLQLATFVLQDVALELSKIMSVPLCWEQTLNLIYVIFWWYPNKNVLGGCKQCKKQGFQMDLSASFFPL